MPWYFVFAQWTQFKAGANQEQMEQQLKQSRDRTAMLMIMGSPQYWDQEEIDTFIESIH